MPSETDTGQERTIPATPRRRQEARRKGQVAKSREVNSALMLMAALAALGLLGPQLLQGIADTFGMFFCHADLSRPRHRECHDDPPVCPSAGVCAPGPFFLVMVGWGSCRI